MKQDMCRLHVEGDFKQSIHLGPKSGLRAKLDFALALI